MPTGYTEKIKDGISFSEFVMMCARGFGALITMKDEPLDSPIPESFQPSEYYKERLDEIIEEFKRICSMSEEECEGFIEAEFQGKVEACRQIENATKDLALRYEDMLCEVDNWQPPTEAHHELKTFMQKQIIDSLSFDCSSMPAPIKESREEWLNRKLNQLYREYNYSFTQNEKEIKNTNERNLWLKQLRDSLPKES